MTLSRSAPYPARPLFFFNDTATTEIYTLSLHDALPILIGQISRRDLLCAAHELLAVPPKRESSLLYLSALVERNDAPIG